MYEYELVQGTAYILVGIRVFMPTNWIQAEVLYRDVTRNSLLWGHAKFWGAIGKLEI